MSALALAEQYQINNPMLLFSRIYGKGEPLLILHGLFGMGDNWVSLSKRFAENYEVHVIDQRNHGKSFHSESWTYQDMVSDLEYYIEEHQLGRVNLLGHSMGGKTAMCFSSMHPKLVKKLIVADIAPKKYPLKHQFILDAIEDLNFDLIHSRKQVDEILSKRIENFGIRQFILKNIYWKEKDKLALRFNFNAIKNNIENVGIALPSNAYFDGPTLFLDGAKSEYINENDEEDISLHFPDYNIEIINDAGHWLHAEQPEKFFELVSDFLNNQID